MYSSQVIGEFTIDVRRSISSDDGKESPKISVDCLPVCRKRLIFIELPDISEKTPTACPFTCNRDDRGNDGGDITLVWSSLAFRAADRPVRLV